MGVLCLCINFYSSYWFNFKVVFKRWMSYVIIFEVLTHGCPMFILINALTERWGKWFEELPESSEEQYKEAEKMIAAQEVKRKVHVCR